MQQRFEVNTYPNRGITLVRGEGAYLYDAEGSRYLDLMTNYGVSIFGHNHPRLVESIGSQLRRLTALHGSFNNDMRAAAAKNLVRSCGGGLSRVYFANSGSEAVEAGIKFAVLATGKKKFIACRNGYHGKTLGALSATDGKKYRLPFEPLLWDFKPVAYNDLQQLEDVLDDETAAFLVEPIQGEGGVNVPDPNYLKQAKSLCEKKGVLLIMDEIQTGMGRTGTFLASQQDGAACDILCLGKGLAGGLPCGATLVTEGVAAKIPRSIHTSTFGGNPLVSAGVVATLELLDDERLAHVREIGNYFREALSAIHSDLVLGVKGKGLMLGIEVKEKRNEILQDLQREKILAIPASDGIVRFLPPYIIEKEQLDTVLGALENLFEKQRARCSCIPVLAGD
jgi:acetylornithine/succinyldiaminopimelate/putrescine aminotransferase